MCFHIILCQVLRDQPIRFLSRWPIWSSRPWSRFTVQSLISSLLFFYFLFFLYISSNFIPNCVVFSSLNCSSRTPDRPCASRRVLLDRSGFNDSKSAPDAHTQTTPHYPWALSSPSCVVFTVFLVLIKIIVASLQQIWFLMFYDFVISLSLSLSALPCEAGEGHEPTGTETCSTARGASIF